MNTHSYRPLREYTGQNKTAREIQSDIDLIRALRIQRAAEEAAGAQLVGKVIITLLVAVPAIAAAIYHLL